MKTVIKIIKGIGYGLFKLHLWLPVAYSAIFIIIALAAGAKDFWIGFFIGLVVSLLCSIALSVYMNKRKLPDGEYGQKKNTRKSLYSDEQSVLPKLREERPQQVKQLQQAKQPDAVPEHSVKPEPNYRELLYKDFAAENTRESKGQSGAHANLYPGDRSDGGSRISGADARALIYQSDDSERENYGGADRRQAGRSELYPGDRAADENGGDRADYRQARRGELYPAEDKERQKFDEYRDFRRDPSAIYPEAGSTKGFASYVQPVNSIMPNRPNVSSNSEALEAAGFRNISGSRNNASDTLYPNFSSQDRQAEVAPERKYEDAETTQSRDNEFLQGGGLNSFPAQRTVIGRRRETPLQIYATRSDQNLYVYEYADRYEYIKLLSDGNKQLLKTEFK